jgi:hypothetical protein
MERRVELHDLSSIEERMTPDAARSIVYRHYTPIFYKQLTIALRFKSKEF